MGEARSQQSDIPHKITRAQYPLSSLEVPIHDIRQLGRSFEAVPPESVLLSAVVLRFCLFAAMLQEDHSKNAGSSAAPSDPEERQPEAD